jgi:hypothetical protein
MSVQHFLPIDILEKEDVVLAAQEAELTIPRFTWFSARLSTHAYASGFHVGKTSLLDIHERPVALPDVSDGASNSDFNDKLLLILPTPRRQSIMEYARHQVLSVDEFLRSALRIGMFVTVNADQPYRFIHDGQEYDFV